MAITAEALRLQARLDRQVQQVTDAQSRALTAGWVYAWAEVSSDLQDTLEELLEPGGVVSRSTMARSIRLRAVLGQVADRLGVLAGQAGVRISSDLRAVVDAAAEAQRGILAAQLPPLLDREAAALIDTRLNDPALDAIVKRSTEQITSRTKPLSADAEDAVRRELIRAVAVGENPRVTARRMVRSSEKGFNGGLNRALTISRTEILSAHREAAQVQQDQNAEVLQGWVWLCHLGPRTCASCLAKSGSLHPLSEPGPFDHPNGRCSRCPKTKSWADLGFDVTEPEDAVPDAEAWFHAQPVEVQLSIMGRERLELLMSGAIGWADLAQKRANPGSRDSWQMTPVKTLRALVQHRAA